MVDDLELLSMRIRKVTLLVEFMAFLILRVKANPVDGGGCCAGNPGPEGMQL